MKDAGRLLRKLRRKVYRDTPVASWNRVADLDWRASYESLASLVARGDCGVLSGGAALALWRAASDAGFRAWCYDFGFPESLTYMVTVIEADGRLRVHDAFLNLEYRGDFYEILDGLRADRPPDIRAETRDRKIYVADPACESQQTLDWLAAHADRELDRQGPLRRFEVLWDRAAFLATLPQTEAIFRDLERSGHPADFSYLMLHPIAMFDGKVHQRERAAMPLIGGVDLHSPLAGLRVAMQRLTQDLTAARAQQAEKSAAAARLEAEIAEAREQLAAAAGEAGQLAQERAALEERRAAAETALAEANASHSAVAEQARRFEDQILQLRSARDDIERAAVAADAEWVQQRQELQGRAQSLDEDNRKLQAAVAGTRAHLAAVRGETGELRATIDQRSAEWEEERQRSHAAAQALEGDVLRLREELAQASAQLNNAQAQGALFERLSGQWEGERRRSQEAVEALEGDVLRLREGLAQTSAQLSAAQTESAEFEHRRVQWENERRSLQSSLQALNQDAQTAFAEWARVQLNAEQAAAQATWSGLQIAELVEREAAAAGELAQARAEAASLRALQSELAAAAPRLGQGDQTVGGFIVGLGRLLGVDDLPSDDLGALLARLRRHIRTLERDLDRAEAERGRLDAMLRQIPAPQKPAAGRLRKFLGQLGRSNNQGSRLADGQFVQPGQLSGKAS